VTVTVTVIVISRSSIIVVDRNHPTTEGTVTVMEMTRTEEGLWIILDYRMASLRLIRMIVSNAQSARREESASEQERTVSKRHRLFT
jgi:hypothetical protein